MRISPPCKNHSGGLPTTLLHGYHNYHHLLLLEEDEHQWLGVPGIYSPREAHAAELFGFPQFTREYHQN